MTKEAGELAERLRAAAQMFCVGMSGRERRELLNEAADLLSNRSGNDEQEASSDG